jgi:hypothetical protein
MGAKREKELELENTILQEAVSELSTQLNTIQKLAEGNMRAYEVKGPSPAVKSVLMLRLECDALKSRLERRGI